jgi:tRNA (guanine37-N1)-methyltransferase
MKITILTLFPEVFTPTISTSILKHAQEKKLVEIKVVNFRDFAEGPHKTVDDKPYGGGVGMVLRVDVLFRALEAVREKQLSKEQEKVMLLDPKGKTYTQTLAKEFSHLSHLILICGHYEGFDARIEKYIDMSISIGDFVLTGGEIPAMAITDSIIRLVPGVLPDGATSSETFEENLLEAPHYTRPAEFNGEKVPEVLLSGNHKEIIEWRKEQQQLITKKLRPDLG